MQVPEGVKAMYKNPVSMLPPPPRSSTVTAPEPAAESKTSYEATAEEQEKVGWKENVCHSEIVFFFFFCVLSYISWVHHFGWGFCVSLFSFFFFFFFFFLSNHRGSRIPSSWLVHAADLFTLRKLRKKPTNFGANYASTKMEPKYKTLRLKTTEIKTPVSSKELSVFDRSQQGWLRPVSVPIILIAPLT